MSLAASCGTIPPVESNYSPKGVIKNVSDLDVYTVVPDSFTEAQTKNAVIICYDIYGFHENVKQFCDILGSQGFLVALPDFFRGDPWTSEKIKGDNFMESLRAWLGEKAPPERVQQHTAQIVEHLRKEYGVQNFGFIGFCWGGMIASKMSKDPTFDGCVLIHPGMLSIEDFKESKCPIAFIPSKDEPDLENLYVKDPALTSKPFASKIVHRRFDLHHGFAGARGDFSKEDNAKSVNEVIKITVDFLNENLGVKY
ncbi:17284_t:CDS:2 [Cetraspora pellucida]|uniref:17284_t:CDS:1 n=1 Tax=Cetraspora pellucida TaxID=1433469 RepID=A0A9N9B690_9GLOM|nr:17284_t:CDS:2 [Cetraspora pellucida]